MNLVSSKNLLPILLATVALLIWAHNSYEFFKGVNQDDDPGLLFNANVDEFEIEAGPEPAKDANWVYEPIFRDPFQNWLMVPKKQTSKKRPNKSRPKRLKTLSAPPLRFIGIIQDENGRMAILEDINKDVHFGYKGDTVAGVKIISVDSTEVGGAFRGKRFTLILK